MQRLRVLLICIGCFVLTEEMNAIADTNEHENPAAATSKNSHLDGKDTGKERTRKQYDSGIHGSRSDSGNRVGYGYSGGWRRKRSFGELGTGFGENFGHSDGRSGNGGRRGGVSGYRRKKAAGGYGTSLSKGLGVLGVDMSYSADGFDTGKGIGGANGMGPSYWIRYRSKRAPVGNADGTADGPASLRSDLGLKSGDGIRYSNKSTVYGYGGGMGMMSGGIRLGMGYASRKWLGGGWRRKRVSDEMGGYRDTESGSVRSGMGYAGGNMLGGGGGRKRVSDEIGVGGHRGVGSDSDRLGMGYGGGYGLGGVGRRKRVSIGDGGARRVELERVRSGIGGFGGGMMGGYGVAGPRDKRAPNGYGRGMRLRPGNLAGLGYGAGIDESDVFRRKRVANGYGSGKGVGSGGRTSDKAGYRDGSAGPRKRRKRVVGVFEGGTKGGSSSLMSDMGGYPKGGLMPGKRRKRVPCGYESGIVMGSDGLC